MMDIEKSFSLLKRHSIPYADWKIAKTAEKAAKAAKKLGFPVVLKVVSRKIIHKSDVGGVRVNIADEQGVVDSFEGIMKTVKATAKTRPEGILVQRMAQGREVIIGLKRDPQFGPVIMFGIGGIFVEVLKDVSLRIAPLTKDDCIEMVDEIKGSGMLNGARGQKPVNIDALIKIMMAVSKIGMKNKNIVEMDLNPVIVNEKSAQVADVRIISEK
jgi:acetyl-CoA synthetase (ADP-forming)